MAFKLAFVVLAVFFIFQLAQSSIVRRDAPATTEKATDLEQALNNLKQNFDEFASKVQNSELFQNATKVLGDIGEQIKEKGNELVQKIKTETATKN